MTSDEQDRILKQLVRMRPDLSDDSDDYSFDDSLAQRQYDACYEVCRKLPGDPDDWVLVEMLDAQTFERKWFWRRKS